MSDKGVRGFTLLEVVVALVIAGLALVVMFRAGGGGLFAVDSAARAEEAVQRAQSHLAAIGSDVALIAGATEGDDGGGYHWHLRVEPAARLNLQVEPSAPAAVATLYRVEVAITWAGRGRDHAVVLKTERLATTGPGR